MVSNLSGMMAQICNCQIGELPCFVPAKAVRFPDNSIGAICNSLLNELTSICLAAGVSDKCIAWRNRTAIRH
jgi:hypothetical protein